MPGQRNGHHPQTAVQREEPRRQEAGPARAEKKPSGVNVGPVERVVSAGAGLLLALLGLARRSPAGVAVAALGAGLVYRGATGHCPVYGALGVDTSGPEPERKGVAPGRGVHVIRAVTIEKPPEELYAFWRRFDNLPRFMRHLESVTEDGNRSHWVAKAPVGTVSWDAEITSDEQGKQIGWRSLPGATVATEGTVRFHRATGDRGTVARVDLRYDPPGGTLGSWLAWLFGEEPSLQVAEDLRRFKQLMETGEISGTEGQPAHRRF